MGWVLLSGGRPPLASTSPFPTPRPSDELTHGLSPIATKSGGRAVLFLAVISIFILKTF